MYNSQDNLKISRPFPSGIIGLLLCLVLSLAPGKSWAAPANDNFAKAAAFTNIVRQVTGTNVGATKEPGEPSHAGNTGGASVWWVWVSPLTGTVEFDTASSTFDTLLSVYTGNSVSSLSTVAANDDVNFPSDRTSRAVFNVTAGTTYYLAVDGYDGAVGAITLNWSPLGQNAAGNFFFASSASLAANGNKYPLYTVTDMENAVSSDTPVMGAPLTRLVVARTGGSSGFMNVAVSITNDLYTNVYFTNLWGTNIFSTNVDNSTMPPTITFTNQSFFYQSNQTWLGYYLGGYQMIMSTNEYSWSTNNVSGTITISNAVYTNFPFAGPDAMSCFNTNGLPPVITVSSNTTGTNLTYITNYTVTQIYCSNLMFIEIVASAAMGVDYQPVTRIYPMWDFLQSVEVNNLIAKPLLTRSAPPGKLPALLKVQISSVAPDSLEDSLLAPPTIDPILGTAFVNVLSTASRDAVPGDNNGPAGTTNSIINFAGQVYRYREGYNSQNFATVALHRSGTDISMPCSVNYYIDSFPFPLMYSVDQFLTLPGSDYATASSPLVVPSGQPADFTSVSGSVSWGAFDNKDKYIHIPVTNDLIAEFNEDLSIVITQPTGCIIGQSGSAILTILDNNNAQIAGAVDLFYNRDNDPTTDPPFNALPGANSEVHSVLVQADGNSLFAGDFTAYNTRPRNHIARAFSSTGQIDEGFLAFPNSGANGNINCLAQQTDQKIMVAGQFTSFNGSNLFSVARLNLDGSVDPSFHPGLGVQTTNGVPGNVLAMALQGDGRIVIAGDFNSVGGTNRYYVARLNVDGSVDSSFDSGAGPNGIVHAMVIQPDNRILIAGEFTSYAGISRPYIARLQSNGHLDITFDPGTGANDTIYAMGLQNDGRIVIGGIFTTLELGNYNHIGRLNPNGGLDPTFIPGSGLDGAIYSIVCQADGTILLGGNFESYNGTRRMGLARVSLDGTIDTSFLDTAYNELAGLFRYYNSENAEPRSSVYSIAVQADGNMIIAGSFSKVGGAPGLYSGVETSGHTKVAYRGNIARIIGGSTPGPGNLALADSSYSADKNGKTSYITLTRTNGFLGAVNASFTTTAPAVGNGGAAEGVDYTLNQSYLNPTWPSTYGSTWMESDSVYGPNNASVSPILGAVGPEAQGAVFINLLNPLNQSGNRTLDMQLSLPAIPNSLTLGAEPHPLGVGLGLAFAPLTIIDPATRHGVIGFSSPTYKVDENGTNAVISLTRTNGYSGVVSVRYQTANGTNNLPLTVGATAGSTNDYLAASGTLVFADGVTNQSFIIPLVNNGQVKPDATVALSLSSFGGGASAGLSNAVLTIINDNLTYGRVSLSSSNYVVHETGGNAIISLTRQGGSAGTIKLTVSTVDGSAHSGVDYTGVTNLLIWNSGDVSTKTVSVPVFHDGLVLTNSKTVGIRLSASYVNTAYQPLVIANSITNATLSILNDDQFGSPSFSVGNFFVNENAGSVTITVDRQGGSAQTIGVNYRTADFTATAGNGDYTPVSGTLTFPPGVFSQNFTVPITEHTQGNAPAGIYAFIVNLTNATPSTGPGGAVKLGQYTNAFVNIIDNWTYNEPPGGLDTTFNPSAYFNNTVYSLALQTNGKILAAGDFTIANAYVRNRIARLNPDGSIDVKFSSDTGGADSTVRSVIVQSDGGILIGGSFRTVASVNRAGVARLNTDGSLDTSFNPGSGLEGTAYSLVETWSGSGSNAVRKILVGGNFTLVNGFGLKGIAQLNTDGSVDQNFVATGANGTVYAVAVYSTNDVNSGKIIIAGDFTTVNGTARSYIARLNADGSLDSSFDPGVGPDQPLRAVAIQIDGKIVIGGLFANVSGSPYAHLARLNSDGTVDAGFNVQPGTSDSVLSLNVQPDLKIVVAGTFTTANGVTRGRLTRLNPDGTVDPTINFGSGANDFISTVAIQPDQTMILGGGFTTYDGVSHPYIARIYGLTEQDAGAVSFTSANFTVLESGTNAVITVQRSGGTTGDVAVDVVTSDGTAIAGQDYQSVMTTLLFPSGETFQSFTVPINNNLIIGTNLNLNLTLQNPQGGNSASSLVLGDQPTALLTILNDNSAVSFSSANYRVVKNNSQGSANVTLLRSGSTIGRAAIDFVTTTNGTASPVIDYTPVTNHVLFADGQSQVIVTVPVINNGLVEGNTTVSMALLNPSNTVVTVPNSALLTIVDNNTAPGNFMFGATNFVVYENVATLSSTTNAAITVVRTNGLAGQVSVQIGTFGGTAQAGVDYIATNQVLAFADGQSQNTFYVTIPHNPRVTGNQTVNIVMTNATGGASILQPASESLTIVDQDVGFGFVQASYFVSETAGSLTVGVQRLGRTNGSFSVGYVSQDGSALAGTSYSTVSNVLTFAAGEILKTFTIPILHDPLVTGNLTFSLSLFNPSAPAQLGSVANALVTVIDVDTGLAFATNAITISKAGGSALVGVVRTGSAIGTVGVSFATSDGTAVAGAKYAATNGVLVFLDGQASNYFTVPIVNDNQVDGNQTVNLALFNPTNNAQLLSPSNAVITIVDNTCGFALSSPSYTINENGVQQIVTVNRVGVTNSYATVNYATTDGSARAGVDYVAASGTLVFTPGQTTASFPVGIIDRGVIGGTVSAVITLSNPQTNAVLVAPSIAALNINDNDGSLIVPAGAALISPTNGLISPGSMVTMLFSLRDGAGQNTSNLVATLLATNGVTSPSSPQTYGVLAANGESVARPFSFVANGTNGGTFTAVLSLQDGTNNLGSSKLVFFTFNLGSTTNGFTNGAPIVINDVNPATPYPSTITVSGLSGVIGKVTLTITNLSHADLTDVDILLVGPTGLKQQLLTHVGGGHGVTNWTFTLDDFAPNSVPAAVPTNGVYRPTVYAAVPMFAPAPQQPYGTTLSGFNGSNPNGVWSLYVQDDNALDVGGITNGWSLNIATVTPVPISADLAIGLTSPPVGAVVTSNITYTISVTNAGPSAASTIVVSNALPVGAVFNSAIPAPTAVYTSGGATTLVWNYAGLVYGATTNILLSIQAPAVPGTYTNLVTVQGAQNDLNPVDNIFSWVFTANAATADLALGLSVTPDPVGVGSALTYSIVVTNLGPATATNLAIVDLLPVGLQFVSGTTSGGIVTQNSGTVTANIASLGSGAVATVTFVAYSLTPGTYLNSANVTSGVLDPLKGNNTAAAKVVVTSVALGIKTLGNNLQFTWPGSSSGYVLQTTSALGNPSVWTPVNSPAPQLVAGQYVVTIPIAGGTQFYRLQAPLP